MKSKISLVIFIILFAICSIVFGGLYFSEHNKNIELKKDNKSIQTKYDNISEEKDKLQQTYYDLQAENKDLKSEYETLKSDYAKLQNDYDTLIAYSIKEDLENIQTSTTEESEGTFDDKYGKYRTDLPYDDLSRKPDDYEGENVCFKGTVVQLIEGDVVNDLRVAINDDYDKIMYVVYDPSIMDSRVLENDTIVFYGIYHGIYTYESTLGASVSVPLMAVEHIEIE